MTSYLFGAGAVWVCSCPGLIEPSPTPAFKTNSGNAAPAKQGDAVDPHEERTERCVRTTPEALGTPAKFFFCQPYSPYAIALRCSSDGQSRRLGRYGGRFQGGKGCVLGGSTDRGSPQNANAGAGEAGEAGKPSSLSNYLISSFLSSFLLFCLFFDSRPAFSVFALDALSPLSLSPACGYLRRGRGWCAGVLVCWCAGLLVCWFAGVGGRDTDTASESASVVFLFFINQTSPYLIALLRHNGNRFRQITPCSVSYYPFPAEIAIAHP